MHFVLYTVVALLPLAFTTPTPEVAPSADAPSGAEATDAAQAGKPGYHGDMTHYSPSAGTGSCNIPAQDGDNVVALATSMMKNGPNPNNNPLCGDFITIDHSGQRHTAKIVDTCVNCTFTDFDTSPSLFKKVAPHGNGRVHHVHWWFNKTANGKRPHTHGAQSSGDAEEDT